MARKRTARGGSGASGRDAVLRFRNRLINTYRGTQANAYGDLSDVGVTYLANIPAALAETSQTYFDAATQRQQIIREILCQVDAWVDIITTDTIQDVTSGTFYLIEGIKAQPGIGYYPAPKILTLRERSGVSIGSD
jgi:hypothetical protein